MKLIQIVPKERDLTDALEVLDSLRQAIVEGSVAGYAVVAIEPDDTVRAWSATTQSVSQLRMMGAIANLLHAYMDGDV